MNNKNKIFFLSFFFFLWLIAFTACHKEEKKDTNLLGQKPSGERQVVFSSPGEKTTAPHEAESVLVVFDRPMIALGSSSKGQAPALIQFNPSFPGKFRWLNPRTLLFSPEKRFPFSTRITATIPKWTSSYDGYMMREDFSWSFETIRPRMIDHYPGDSQKWFPPDPSILLVFNQPVQAKKARDFLGVFELREKGGETSVEIDIKTPAKEMLEEHRIVSSPSEVLLVVPKKRLSFGSTCLVSLQPGFPAKEGNLGMEKGLSFRFEIYGQIRLEEFIVAEEHNPYDALQFRFSNPVFYKEFVQKIKFQPPVKIPDYYSEWEERSNNLWLSLPLNPETEYTIQVDASLQDVFGNKLSQEVEKKFLTASFPPSFSMSTGHGIIDASGEPKFHFTAVNLKELEFQVARLKKDDIIPLLIQDRFLWANYKFSKKNFFQVEQNLHPELTRNKKEIVSLDLGKYLPEKKGILFVQMDPHLDENGSRYPKAFLQVTSLGLSAKFSPDSTLIWLTGLHNSSPVAGASVELRDDRNRILWKGVSGEDGRCRAPGWHSLKLKSPHQWSQPRVWVFAEKEGDVVFISSDWETGVYPYCFGLDYDWNPQPVPITGYIYTDRGIYRAGETVNLKGIIRQKEKGEWKHPSAGTVKCEVYDPFQKMIYKESFRLDEYSSFSFSLDTEVDAPLGSYRVVADLPLEEGSQERTSFSSRFRLEAFRPAEFEVHIKSAEESYTFGETYQAEVKASYLSGGPMSSQEVGWYLRLNPASFSPPGFEGYIFGNLIDRWQEDGEKSRLVSSGQSKLDENGKIGLSAALKPEKERDSVVASLEATVRGPSRRAVSSRIQTIVHRGDFYIGLKPETTFLEKGKKVSVKVATVNGEGEIDPGKKIELKLFRREWHSVRKEGMGGSFHWISEKEDIELESRALETEVKPSVVSFVPEKAGFYLIKAEGNDRRGNTVTTTAYFYATGGDYVHWERSDDDVVELVTDRSSYCPGDKARLLVKSPYLNSLALVSLERENVMESWVVELEGTSDFLTVPLASSHIPNVFVSVLLLQSKDDLGKEGIDGMGDPSMKIGYVSLTVEPEEKRLAVEIAGIKPDYRPGEEVSLKLRVKDSKGRPSQADLSLAVVDLGVLNLIGFQTPDPFSAYYRHQSLAVHTADNRYYLVHLPVLGEKGEEVAGGAGEGFEAAALPLLSEVELRGDFRFTAYWNPSIETDDTGEARVKFTLPDNLTTFRVMAVAQTKNSCFGRAEKTFKVSKTLLLRASFPRFARLGDEFQAGVVVHNNSGKDGEIILNCRAEGISLLDKEAAGNFMLKAGEAEEISFSFLAEKPGEAMIEFRGKMGEETDGLEVKIPLKKPKPTEAEALFASTSDTAEELIEIPENINPSESRLDILLSPSALAGIKESYDYLAEYPYLCLEQRLSSVLPYLVAGDMLLEFGLSRLDAEKMKQHVREELDKIKEYQRENGGFGLWTDSVKESPFISCYAGLALTKARAKGIEIDSHVLSNLIEYLQGFLRNKVNKNDFPYGERSWNTVQAFALYILALLDKPEPGYSEKLFTNREGLSTFAKTLLLKAIYRGKGADSARDILVQELLNMVKMAPTTAHFEDDEGSRGGWIYSSGLRTTAFVLQSLLEAGENPPFLPDIVRWLVEKKKAGKRASTQENFFFFYALNEFYKRQEKEKPDFAAEIYFAGKKILEETFKERDIIRQTGQSLNEVEQGKLL
ncbi:MAG: alpha-2-macroglobulin family protein, partial [Acidobacteriota bacterium]